MNCVYSLAISLLFASVKKKAVNSWVCWQRARIFIDLRGAYSLDSD